MLVGTGGSNVIIGNQSGINNTTGTFSGLTANTYNVSVWWKSVANPLGFNSLKTGNLYAENTYTLKIREISL